MNHLQVAKPFKLSEIIHEIDGAIFDVDGTLLDSMAIWDVLGARCLAAFGIELDAEMTADLARELTPMTLKEACEYLHEHYELSSTNKATGDRVTVDDLIMTSLQILENFYRCEVQLKPGIKELLMSVRELGIPMAIATSGEQDLVEQAMSRLGVRECFCEILTCSDYQTNKRSPVIFRLAALKMGTRPCRTFVFEDAYFALRSARLGGFRTVGVWDRSNVQEHDAIKAIADYYIADLAEPIDFVR